ncbi:hypothetical protein CF5_0145 [Staphylococcus phage CF5]|uniref:Uncharacterized protein n=1 Tax=Staphylococcus phage CF5 TaxID=3113739 RepID=A0AAX4J7R3_9CAUD|nr:hypothetical protein CF5_0145 [Staphylococcus phage CF5]
MENLIDTNMLKVKETLGNANSTDVLPLPYIEIAKKFKEVKDNKESIIIEEGGFPYTDSTVMYITHVASRWVGGYSLVRHEGKEIRVPRTLHYSDIYVKDKSHKVKIIFEGANPYED